MKLVGKVAIVTGAARGIGAGIAQCLAEEGAGVGILDIDGDEAAKTAAALPTKCVGIAADISSEAAARDATEAVVAQLGRLDILVNNAGGGGPNALTSIGRPFTNIDEAGWDDALATNLRTVFAATKAAIPHLKSAGSGAIVNIASIAGLIPSVPIPAYGAAKAGVIGLTRTLAIELAENDIRVNAICPGYLWTRAWEMLTAGLQMSNPELANVPQREIFLRIVRESTPLGREQTPGDIGKLATFLAGPDAANITGQVIAVDGGTTLMHPGR